jgi:predicted Zn-dependent protease
MGILQIMRGRAVAVAALAGVVMALAWAARQPGTPLRPSGFNLFTRAQDVELGEEAAHEIRKQHEVVRDQMLQNYLRRVGARLAAAPEARDSGFAFTFTVLNEKEVNAYAVPGGPMFVNMGLFRAVDNEAQLAGAMAHEMGHVILRHGTAQMSKQNLLEIPAILAAEVTGSRLLARLAEAGVAIGVNRFTRGDESEADAMGAHLMAGAGWDPVELGRFFEKLRGTNGPSFLAFLSDHPDPGNRERAIADELRTMQRRSYGYETGQFRRMKAELRRLPSPPVKSVD